MKKRGQVGVFIVVGIIVLVTISLVFFFRDSLTKTIRQEPTNVQEYLTQQLDDIKTEIGKCVNQETDKASKLLMKNGGLFERDFGNINYIGVSYPILCREINQTGTCLSEPILIINLQEKLNGYLPEKISKCINLENYKGKDYSLTTGKINLSSQILDEFIVVEVNYPVKLTKGSNSASENRFVYKLNIPLGVLTKVSNDLVQTKADGKEISVNYYNLLNFNKYLIDVKKPYPDEVYDISLTTNDKYHFYFGIEGIGRFNRPEGSLS